MNVLTPFPNQPSMTQTFDRPRIARLRTEINQVFDAALRDSRFVTATGAQAEGIPYTGTSSMTGAVPPVGAYAHRNPILALQSEINRIINLVLQSAYASQGQATPVFGQTAGWQWGQTVPGWVGQQGIPFGQFASAQHPFAQYPGVHGAVGQYPVAWQGMGVVPGTSVAVTLLSEINRVFNSFLQEAGSVTGPVTGTVTGTGGYAGLYGYGWPVQNPVAALQAEINRVFNSVLDGPGTYTPATFGFTPCINLAETEDAIELEAELPGFSLGEIDLQVNGNLLTIKGWRRRSANEEGKEYHLIERNYGTFVRSITLPFDVDPELINASFEEGVLMITISKPANVRENTHRITIAKAS